MAQANCLTNAILAPITGASPKPSTIPMEPTHPVRLVDCVARGSHD
jgi:hypothetical protein